MVNAKKIMYVFTFTNFILSSPRWQWFKLPYDTYGKVMWDTHIYTFSQEPGTSDNVDEVLSLYEKALNNIRKFQESNGSPVIVGEFTLTNLQ